MPAMSNRTSALSEDCFNNGRRLKLQETVAVSPGLRFLATASQPLNTEPDPVSTSVAVSFPLVRGWPPTFKSSPATVQMSSEQASWKLAGRRMASPAVLLSTRGGTGPYLLVSDTTWLGDARGGLAVGCCGLEAVVQPAATRRTSVRNAQMEEDIPGLKLLANLPLVFATTSCPKRSGTIHSALHSYSCGTW